MSNTLKYLLIGGAALGVVVVIGRRTQAQNDASSKPSGIAAALLAGKEIFTSIAGGATTKPADATVTRMSGTPAKLAMDGLPYGPGASDGFAAVSDATGMRATNAYVPAQASYLTRAQGAIVGIN